MKYDKETHTYFIEVRETPECNLPMTNPDSVYKEFEDLGNARVEVLFAVFLNAKNIAFKKELLSEGTVDRAACYVREVVRKALLNDAVGVIIVHNHPSGEITPSSSDVDLTNKVNNGLKGLDIKLLDHIIIGKDNKFSFQEAGYIN